MLKVASSWSEDCLVYFSLLHSYLADIGSLQLYTVVKGDWPRFLLGLRGERGISKIEKRCECNSITQDLNLHGPKRGNAKL